MALACGVKIVVVLYNKLLHERWVWGLGELRRSCGNGCALRMNFNVLS